MERIRFLWIGKERTIKSFQGFFTVIGEKVASDTLFVCSDMWQPYMDVIRQKCAHAVRALDRFHIAAKVSKALDEVRTSETRRLSRDGYQPVLKKSRWCVLKRKENLSDKQQVRLRALLRYNLQTVSVYLLKEDFQQYPSDICAPLGAQASRPREPSALLNHTRRCHPWNRIKKWQVW